MSRLYLLVSLVWLLVAMPALAQPPPDPIGAALFTPELVMQNQQAIGLTEQQTTVLKEEMRQAQLLFTDQQWKLQGAVERMEALINQPRVDEKKALAQLQEVLAAEREVKRTQITLLVRIKNLLSEAQQNQLRAIRAEVAK